MQNCAEIQADHSALYTFDINWTVPAQVPLPPVEHVHIGSVSAFISPGPTRSKRS